MEPTREAGIEQAEVRQGLEGPQREKRLSQVIQIGGGKIQEHLGEVVRSTVEETLNAVLDAEADRLCRAERYERTEARKDTRAGHLGAAPADESGGSHAESAEAAHAAIRDGDYRAVPAAGEFGGRSIGGDVSCRGERAASGGHHRSVVGHASQPQHGQRAEPEDLRAD